MFGADLFASIYNKLFPSRSAAVAPENLPAEAPSAAAISLQKARRRQQTLLRLSYSDRTFKLTGAEGDVSVFGAIAAADGRWEPHIMNLMSKIVHDDDICLDIGANIGVHTLVLSDLAPHGRVYSFEPSSITSHFLATNIQDNNLGHARCEPMALGREKGTAQFTHLVGLEGCSFVTPDRDVEDVLTSAWGTALEHITQTVEVNTLDDWIAENHVDRVNFVKLDAEGFELAVLDGGRKTFERHKPSLIVELNRNTLAIYYGVPPREFFERLSSIYEFIYIIHEDTDQPPTRVTSFDEIEPLLDLPSHWWVDLLCMPREFPR